MKAVEVGVLSKSVCFSFTPSELALDMFYYLTWCGHYYCTSSYYIKRDYFDPILIVYVEKGIMNVTYRGEAKKAGAGDIVFIDCNWPHYYQAKEGLEFYYLHFDGANSHEMCKYIMDTQGWLIRKDSNRNVYEKIRDIVSDYQSNHEPGVMEISASLYEIFRLLLEPSKKDLHELEPVEKCVRYIRQNVGKAITLKELSNLVSVSPYYLAHLFKRQTGFAPLEYVINTRIERAKTLLVTTGDSVTEIAYKVGYATSGSLINIFIKKVGISPKEYRNMYRGK